MESLWRLIVLCGTLVLVAAFAAGVGHCNNANELNADIKQVCLTAGHTPNDCSLVRIY